MRARADTLAALVTSYSVPDGKIGHITISSQRLLTALSKALDKSISEGTCGVEMVVEPIEVWHIPFLNFLKQG